MDRSRARGLTLDTGALIAYERGQPRVLGHLAEAQARDWEVTVPASCVVEAWRGGSRGARLARLLRASAVQPVDEWLARRAGELLGRAGADDPTDAVVVVAAAARGDAILTSDPDDIRRLAAPLGGVALLTV